MTPRTLARAALAIVAVFNLVIGVWAFFAPRSFFENVGAFPPYNEHFIHDIGAFELGLGVTAAAALVWSDGLSVALAGNAVAAVVHWVAHLIDRDLGGRSTDPFGLGLLALAIVLALLKVAGSERAEAGRLGGTPD